ncbi:FAD-dependent monooxygenase [Kitasatospora viridis]|uniref:2-polyprenyl-6-methoxyphenol hydroxylase-like FAD-dependent oxidoreductase n=1 Tax=Kitasatospora viridis TaxID=281105 RepID=A0A561UI46_9ACTN|nr:FAD-dependent monooxygenase [Kitasatospora viridis]TWF99043.1 2-polyprenyl-6-methoxyphenol hydroxylase-like FAD-dependent oxidoreductase [Kitasatospora viridis]
MKVLIAGAGIGGLCAALSLAEAGIEVTVVESVREIRPLGLGVNLQPHAVRELVELGLGDALAAGGIATAEHVYTDERGAELFSEPRGVAAGYRWPQYSVHRGELQQLLLDAVRERLGAGAVVTGTRVVGFDSGADGVTVRLASRGSVVGGAVVGGAVAGGGVVGDGVDGGSAEVACRADVLVGADGLHSAVRAQLHPAQGPMLWSGTLMYRGAVEADPYLTGRSMVISQGPGRVAFLAYPISGRAADRGRSLVNWVCQVPVAEPGPLLGEADWNRPVDPAELLDHLVGWEGHWLDVPALVRASSPILRFPMVDREPLASWGGERVTLLGDAAHPMYPVGANGASQAIVDARVLAYHLASGGSVGAALAAYEQERIPATAAVVRAARVMLNSDAAVGAVTADYRRATGAEVERLNARPSLTPAARG